MFGKDEVRDWLETLSALYCVYIKEYGITCSRLCTDTLRHAVESCSMDMRRFRDNRDLSDGLSTSKSAAFFAKWIIRLRPITFDNEALALLEEREREIATKKLIFANEDYALLVAIIFLGVNTAVMDPKYRLNFIYNFHFHGVKSTRQLSTEFDLLPIAFPFPGQQKQNA